MQDVLEKSDHLMAAAKDLFVDFPRRRTGKSIQFKQKLLFLSNRNPQLAIWKDLKSFVRHHIIYITSTLEWIAYSTC